MAGTILASTGLVSAPIAAPVVAARQQEKANRRSRRLQQRANRIQSASSSVERARQRRRAVANARVAQAQNLAAAASQGTLGSSPLQGAQASISSGLAENLAGINRQFTTAQTTFDLRQQAADAEARGRERADRTRAIGQGAQAIQNLGAQLFL